MTRKTRRTVHKTGGKSKKAMNRRGKVGSKSFKKGKKGGNGGAKYENGILRLGRKTVECMKTDLEIPSTVANLLPGVMNGRRFTKQPGRDNGRYRIQCGTRDQYKEFQRLSIDHDRAPPGVQKDNLKKAIENLGDKMDCYVYGCDITTNRNVDCKNMNDNCKGKYWDPLTKINVIIEE